MKLEYDPGEEQAFWQAIEQLPGYPAGEHMPLPIMLFESNAIDKLPAVLAQTNTDPQKHLLVVMDKTPMTRKGKDLKQLVMQIVAEAGWQVETILMEPDATGQVHTDMPHIDAVKQHIRPGSLFAGGWVRHSLRHHQACQLFV